MTIEPEMHCGIDMRFGHNDETGQMAAEERIKMFDTFMGINAKTIIDVGTWKGFGSTYIAAEVAYRTDGIVHTIECDQGLSDSAKKRYVDELPHLADRIVCHCGSSPDVIASICADSVPVDAIILDGGISTEDFTAVHPYLSKTSVVVCHDWLENKCAGLAGRLAEDKEWILVEYETINTYDMAIWRRG